MSEAIILPHEIGEGKDREVHNLLADRWRKLVVITKQTANLLLPLLFFVSRLLQRAQKF